MPLRPLYPSKKALKESIGHPLSTRRRQYSDRSTRADGVVVLESENWAAEVTMKDGKILKVR